MPEAARDDIQRKIDETVKGHRMVLYMKGTPDLPMCGFSAAVVQILQEQGYPFEAVNVLEDPAVREGIKAYSSWPTIPQLYLGGELVGGCDIVREMHESGELRARLRQTFEAA